MNYSQLITAVKGAISTRIAAEGGKVVVAESLEEAHAFLEAAPNGWRLILHWEGYGEHPEARMGMTVHQVATVIQAPRGLPRDKDPTKDKPGGAKGFHHYITTVSDWMCAMKFPNGTGADNAGFAPAGSQWLQTVPGFGAHVLNWKLNAALPPYTQNITLSFPHLNP